MRRPAPLLLPSASDTCNEIHTTAALAQQEPAHKPTPPTVPRRRPDSSRRRPLNRGSVDAVPTPSDSFWAGGLDPSESDARTESDAGDDDDAGSWRPRGSGSVASSSGSFFTAPPMEGSPLHEIVLSPAEVESARGYVQAQLAREEPWWVAPLRERAAVRLQGWWRGNVARWQYRQLLLLDAERYIPSPSGPRACILSLPSCVVSHL